MALCRGAFDELARGCTSALAIAIGDDEAFASARKRATGTCSGVQRPAIVAAYGRCPLPGASWAKCRPVERCMIIVVGVHGPWAHPVAMVSITAAAAWGPADGLGSVWVPGKRARAVDRWLASAHNSDWLLEARLPALTDSLHRPDLWWAA